MQQEREIEIHRSMPFAIGLVLTVGCCLGGCGGSVYPASECKPPPPPLTVPNSPRSQCREVSTEHAKDWPQQYKDIQYLEENAVYRVRLAYSELSDATQKQLHSDFAQAVVDVNSADGKYLQLVDAAAGSSGGDYKEATKLLTQALEQFVNFLGEHLESNKGAMTSSAKKDLDRANAFLQQLKAKAAPPSSDEGKTDESKPTDDKTDENTEDNGDNIVKT